jgi:hypothetical protein
MTSSFDATMFAVPPRAAQGFIWTPSKIVIIRKHLISSLQFTSSLSYIFQDA